MNSRSFEVDRVEPEPTVNTPRSAAWLEPLLSEAPVPVREAKFEAIGGAGVGSHENMGPDILREIDRPV